MLHTDLPATGIRKQEIKQRTSYEIQQIYKYMVKLIPTNVQYNNPDR